MMSRGANDEEPRAETPPMTISDRFLYAGILALHYPLRLTFATANTTKQVAATTVALPGQALNLATSTASAVTHEVQNQVHNAIDLTKNTTQSAYNLSKRVVTAPTRIFQHTHNDYDKNYVKFQAAAFEKERQHLKQEILKLHDELKKGQQKSGSIDKDRVKCDRQIQDLQEQVTRIHLTYTQQKQHLMADFEKERHQHKQDMTKMNQQLLAYEQQARQLTIDFEKERQELQEEVQKLRRTIIKLEEELQRYENQNEEGEDETNEEQEETDVYQKLESIKRDSQEYKKKISDFKGSVAEDEFHKINEKLSAMVKRLEDVDVTNNSAIKKKRKEALKFIQKCQEELKNKI